MQMVHMNPRLFFLVLLMLLGLPGIGEVCAQQNEARVALVIGNAAYPDADAPLKDPVNNVRAFAEELKRVGFEVDVGENLTKQAMRSALDRFYGKIKSGAICPAFLQRLRNPNRAGRPIWFRSMPRFGSRPTCGVTHSVSIRS